MTHICVSKLTIIGSDNGLLPVRHQAIIWTNAVSLSTGPLGTNFSQIVLEIKTFAFTKMCLKMSSGKCRTFCLGLNVLRLLCKCACCATNRTLLSAWLPYMTANNSIQVGWYWKSPLSYCYRLKFLSDIKSSLFLCEVTSFAKNCINESHLMEISGLWLSR